MYGWGSKACGENSYLGVENPSASHGTSRGIGKNIHRNNVTDESVSAEMTILSLFHRLGYEFWQVVTICCQMAAYSPCSKFTHVYVYT